ncbi:MAG: AmmeMemoRadiSam system radical SAM enzyme [Anaerolineales bacterium]
MRLQAYLDQFTMPSQLKEEITDEVVRCLACAHTCRIKPGQRGICKLRFNKEGQLLVPWGYVSSLQVDPIEKKPFYHFLAGADALTFGMLGCNFRCDYCQNWITSQALREQGTDRLAEYVQAIKPDELVDYGLSLGAEVVASSYNEPLITSEWALDIFKQAEAAGLKQVYVSNGFATREVLDFLKPYLKGFKVDLKTMQANHYRDLGGQLQPVLDSIAYAVDLGFWVEIVTLLVPGFNDSNEELQEMADFIYSVSPEIPWHVTAFRPEYKMRDVPRTNYRQILEAVEIGYQTGLQYVYGGNLPGSLGKYEHTHCHNCQAPLIKRMGFSIQQYRITGEGTCPDCGTRIPGVWRDQTGSNE